VSVTCKGPWYQYDTSCALTFSFDRGIVLRPAAKIVASFIELTSSDGSVSVLADAKLDTAGLGTCVWNRPFAGDEHLGAGHGGIGGSCGLSDVQAGKAYGDATDPTRADPAMHFAFRRRGDAHNETSFFGSPSFHQSNAQNSTTCCGGGMLIVNAAMDVTIDGLLTASAQQPCVQCASGTPAHPSCPCCDEAKYNPNDQHDCSKLSGASAGTVIVRSGGTFNGTGAVEAKGGDADVVCGGHVGAGGGGGRRRRSNLTISSPTTSSLTSPGPRSLPAAGRIQLPTPPKATEPHASFEGLVSASGGRGASTSAEPCQSGGAGSILYTNVSRTLGPGRCSNLTSPGPLFCCSPSLLPDHPSGRSHERRRRHRGGRTRHALHADLVRQRQPAIECALAALLRRLLGRQIPDRPSLPLPVRAPPRQLLAPRGDG
jgi:hypothetical protein